MNIDALIPHTLRSQSVESRRRARLIIYAIGVANLASLSAVGMMLWIGQPGTAAKVLLTIVTQTSTYAVLRVSRSTAVAGHYLVCMFFAGLVYDYGADDGYSVLATIVLPLAAAHLVGVRAGVVWTVIGVIWAGVVFASVRSGGESMMALGLSAAIMTLLVGIASTIVESTRSRAVAEAANSERRLRHHRDRIRAFAESTFPGIAETTEQGTSYVSQGLKQLLGYDPDQFANRPIVEYVHPDDLPRLQQLVQSASTKGFRAEVRMRHADGGWVWLEVYGIPDGEGDEDRWIFAARDIRDERQSRDQLLQAQRLEGIGVLAAGVAHDFNNLLTVIMGSAELIPDSELQQNIVNAANEAAELTSGLMAFGRKGPLAEGSVDVVDAVRRQEGMFRSLLGEEIELSMSLPTNALGTTLAAVQLNQVLLNLVTNAKEALGDGGHIGISVNSVVLESTRPESLELAPGPHLLIEVTDDGCGMSDTTREHAFDPFFSTKNPARGSGLGLASVYGIVRQAGGAVELDSHQGRGTAVRVYLPEVDVGPSAEIVVDPSAIEAEAKYLVLIVEDDARIRPLIERTLRSDGFDVMLAANGQEALSHASRRVPSMLVTDIVMPGMRGTEVARLLREAQPALPILFISGYADSTIDRSAWVQDPKSRFLAKPFRSQELIEQVHALLNNAEVA